MINNLFSFSKETILVICFFLIFTVNNEIQAQCPSSELRGAAFLDLDFDGTYDADESGVGNVRVEIYGLDGLLAEQTITNSNGDYSFTNLDPSESFRVEFTFPNGYLMSYLGPDNGSQVQFHNPGECNASLGLRNTANNCGDDPDIYMTCFIRGDQTENLDEPTIVSTNFQFNAGSAVSVMATKAQTGAVWGLAYHGGAQELYSSAFIKQYASLTAAGHDAIFKTSLVSGNTSLFVELASLGINVGNLAITDSQDCDYGAQVGKIGLGAMVLSHDEREIYVVNLFDNTIVNFPINNPTAANTTVIPVPDPGCNAGDYRVFALKMHLGKLYVGVTCTAETSQNATHSSANVYEMDLSDNSFNLMFTTNYLKGYWYDDPANSYQVNQWLTDLDFTDEGNMIIGLTDRLGHRFCFPATGGRLDGQLSDILMVWNDNGVWKLESNGTAGTLSGAGLGNGEGPGGGEFFGDDYFPANEDLHPEVALGSMYVNPNNGEVVSAVYDPLFNTYSGGLHRYNTTDGKRSGAVELYQHDVDVNFGKATGFGDIVGKCGALPPEVGNFVWFDENKNGVQDAGEQGIAGVDMLLLDENCNHIGTSTTNSSGSYYFNSTNVDTDQDGTPDGLATNSNYCVAISPIHYNSNFYNYEVMNMNMIPATALGSDISSQLVKDGTKCPDVDGLGYVDISLGSVNVYNQDIGLVKVGDFDLALTSSINSVGPYKIGDPIEFKIKVTNEGCMIAKDFTIVDYINSNYTFDEDLNSDWRYDGENAKLKSETLLCPGEMQMFAITLVLTDSDPDGYANAAEISGATDQFCEPADDIDSVADDNPDNDGSDPTNNAGDPDDETEDDFDVKVLKTVDLALSKVIREDRVYAIGENVVFDIEVCNQGCKEVSSLDINEVFPVTDLGIDLDENPGWESLGDGNLTYTLTELLSEGECSTISIEYTILNGPNVDCIESTSEIASFVPVDPSCTLDIDSTPDRDNENDKGGNNDDGTDNMTNDNGDIDEDDHDPVFVKVNFFDLALKKTAGNEKVEIGDEVTFDITVYNQGFITANIIDLIDYMPAGTVLSDPNWTIDPADPSGRTVRRTITLAQGLAPGAEHTEQITVRIEGLAASTILVNYAEIACAQDLQGTKLSDFDIDSQADSTPGNDSGGNVGTSDDNSTSGNGIDDEDDHDPALVFARLPEYTDPCVCLDNATTQDNGQFGETITVTSLCDETWYIDFVNQLYDPASAAPPAAPTPYVIGPGGVTLVESPVVGSPGVCDYVLTGVFVTGEEYNIRLTNGEGDFIQFTAGGCEYQYPAAGIVGVSAACATAVETYTVTPEPGCTYAWTLSSGGTIVGSTTGASVEVEWDAVPGGPHTLEFVQTCPDGCIAPTVLDVYIGSEVGSIACVHDLNVSLDSDCQVEITSELLLAGDPVPNAAYTVMVLDAHGHVIPGNLVTDAHKNQAITAKLIDACSGNSCWANIMVEDKQPPVAECAEVSLTSAPSETYEPVAYDNCSADEDIVIEMISEEITKYECDPVYLKEVVRSYIATDGCGNVSTPCTQTIKLRRIDLDDIVLPPSYLISDMTSLSCPDVVYNDEGFPDVSITGVPTLDGKSLYPDFHYYCNIAVDYRDVLISDSECVKKFMRTWIILEDYCLHATPTNYTQTIEIEDREDPILTCPADLTVSSGGTSCDMDVFIPSPETTDDCTTDFRVDLTYPGGFLSDIGDGATINLEAGLHTVEFTVYDACGNSQMCNVNLTVEDVNPPVAVCDEFSVISLRSDGSAEAYASVFDDGSYDDCSLRKFLVRRMDPGTCECPTPSFNDHEYLGEYNGKYYYLSDAKVPGAKAVNLGYAHGGHLLVVDDMAEQNWVYNAVQAVSSNPYYIGLTDTELDGSFSWINSTYPTYTNWDIGTAQPDGTGAYTVVNAAGLWEDVDGSLMQFQYVLELSDPCGFSDYVSFCCDDVVAPGEELPMVVFRAIDYFGNYNQCMVSVEVQDKTPPSVTCPDDVTIECGAYGDFTDLSQFGGFSAMDACALTLDTIIENNINQCGVGTITRTFIAADNNGSASCTQVITVENNDPFDASTISFPGDTTLSDGCSDGNITPESLNGYPTYTSDACDMVAATYKDEIFLFAGNSSACFKLLRTWTVIDWCQMDVDPDYEPEVYPQTIKINNAVDPVITSGCEADTICTFDCVEDFIQLVAMAEDDCTPDDQLAWEYEIDFDIDGEIDRSLDGNGNAIVASGIYPIGSHIIYYTFEDRCGNKVTCAKSFVIKNCKAPTAACIHGLAVALEPMDTDDDGTPDNEMACIFAEMLDASSAPACPDDCLVFSFSRDTSDTKRTYDCFDIGIDTIELWVTDKDGDQDVCITWIEVQDNNEFDFCPDPKDCITFPETDLVVNECNPDLSPDALGSMLTVDQDCFCPGTVSFSDTNVPYPNADCVVLRRTWTVTFDCGAADDEVCEFEQFITVFNQEAPDIDCPDNVVAVGDGTANCVGDVTIPLPIASGTCNTGLVITHNSTFADNASGADASGSYPVGTTEVTFTVTDACGNTATCSMTVTVSNTAPPVCNLNDNVELSLDVMGNLLVTGDLIDNGSMSACGGNVSFTIVPNMFDCDDIGTNLVNVTVSDDDGNTTTCSTNIIIEDGEAPMCNLQDITVNLDAAGNASIDFDDVNNGSFDACGMIVDTTIMPTTFDCSNIGTNIVTITLTDDSGNMTSCTANVVVEDDIAPMCTVDNITISIGASNMITITGDDLNISTSDLCGTVVDTSIMPNVFDCDDLGVNIVVVTVTDDSGNTSTCVANVTVTDMTVPMCSVQDITVTLNDVGAAIITAGQIDNGSTGGCTGDFDISINRTQFFCNDAGDNIVVFTLETDSGQTCTATALVTVVDDSPPVLTSCPANMTLPCGTDITDLTAFGTPNFTDNCPQTLTVDEQVVQNLNVCNVGVITRTWTASDGAGATAECVQIITIEPGDPLTLAGITWPASPFEVGDCVNSLDISNLDTGMPVIDGMVTCSNTSFDFVDIDPDPNNMNFCNKDYNRVWTVIDSCQLNGMGGGVFTFSQIIQLRDTLPPLFTMVPGDTSIILTAPNCEVFVNLPATAVDTCSNAGPITVTNDSPYANNNNSADASGTYPAGLTIVTLTATDICGNAATHEYFVSVVDTVIAGITCNKAIRQLPDSLSLPISTTAYQTMIDTSSMCMPAGFTFSYSNLNPLDTIRTFDCTHVGPPFNFYIYLFAGATLVDSCLAELFLDNPSGGCPSPFTGDGGVVSGKVMSDRDEAIEGVGIEVMDSPMLMEMTNLDGEYTFPTMHITGEDYSVVPHKDDDHLNGVSTLDLIHIQRHILGLQPLDSPYKLIAADIDHSESISAIDILELRKLILGIYDELPNNTSWRMIDAAHVFVDPTQPFAFGFPEQYEIYEFAGDMEIDFIGVKVGDINNTAKLSLNGSVVDSRSGTTVNLNTEEKYLEPGVYDITFNSQHFEALLGFQFTMEINDELGQIIDVVPNNEVMAKDNFSKKNIAQGMVSCSWNKPLGLEDVTSLFTVQVMVNEPVWVSELFVLNSNVTPAEAYTGDGVDDIAISYQRSQLDDDLILYQNKPNPWTNSTDITFFTKEHRDVTINVFNVNGQLLYNKSWMSEAGSNVLTLEKSDLNGSGVMYYELLCNDQRLIKKMILIK